MDSFATPRHVRRYPEELPALAELLPQIATPVTIVNGRTTPVELSEHPRRATQRLRVAERLAVAGRLRAEPDAHELPRVRARIPVQ